MAGDVRVYSWRRPQGAWEDSADREPEIRSSVMRYQRRLRRMVLTFAFMGHGVTWKTRCGKIVNGNVRVQTNVASSGIFNTFST